jgi:hypothetical protein
MKQGFFVWSRRATVLPKFAVIGFSDFRAGGKVRPACRRGETKSLSAGFLGFGLREALLTSRSKSDDR